MAEQLKERLKGHITALKADRVDSVDDTDAPPSPTSLEYDLIEAILKIDELGELCKGLNDEASRSQRLLHQSVEELGRYRDWANQVRYVAGAGPAGAL